MEQLKHECGVAMIRLLKPLEYYEEKYGLLSLVWTSWEKNKLCIREEWQ